jgi:two-component system, cell cycle sensor histidine kinase and response regulator CckA
VGDASKTTVVRKAEPPKGGVETILLVEDDEAVRKTCNLFLESLGYKVLVAATPAQALEMTAQYPETIHLLLTDVIMPGKDGLQLANEISLVRPGIKVLLMSGYTAAVLAKRGAPKHNMPLITKPFTRIDLAGKVRGVLEKQ